MQHVAFQETVIWGGHISSVLAKLFYAAQRRLAACYVAHVTAKGKFGVSVLRVQYQVTSRGIRGVSFHRSSRGPLRFRLCVRRVVQTQTLPRPRRTWRVSQAFAFAPNHRLARFRCRTTRRSRAYRVFPLRY